MFFVLSKMLWFIIQPSHVIVWLALATTILSFLGRWRHAQWAAATTAGVLIVLGCSPLGYLCLQGIENRYARPTNLSQVDGIVILGGGNGTSILQSRGAYGQDRGTVRLLSAYVLAQRYPAAKVVFSGGSGELNNQTAGDGFAARAILLDMGLAPSRLTVEEKSRNTWENLTLTKRLLHPKPREVWVLATSAFHMPRAMGIARKIGWTVVPWPTDYRTTRQTNYAFENVADNLDMVDVAIREYIGLCVYRLSGKST